jgi:hypothetical protein
MKAFEPKLMEDRAAGFWCSEIWERLGGEDPGKASDALVCSPVAQKNYVGEGGGEDVTDS